MTPLLALAPAVLAALTNTPKRATAEEMKAYAKGETTSVVSDSPTGMDVSFETADVKEGTVCYVDDLSAEALSKVGYPIEVTNENGVKRYSYLASAGTPMIKGASVVGKDDCGSLIGRIARLEGDAIVNDILGMPDPIPSSVDNLVLAYLRSFNRNYVCGLDSLTDDASFDLNQWLKNIGKEFVKGVSWSAISGPVNAVYTKAQDLVIHEWQPIYKYFSHYVESKYWSDTYHCSYDKAPDGSDSWTFKDPVGHSSGIDLIHMFASIDGGYKYTSALNPILKQYFGDQLGDLSSWAGDLQSTVCEYFYDFDIDLTDPIKILRRGSSEDDLLADMDAVNITHDYLTGVGFLHDAVESYYSKTKTMHKRCWDFVKNVCGSRDLVKFKDKVYSYLGVEYRNGEWFDAWDYTLTNSYKYLIIKAKFSAKGINDKRCVDTAAKRGKVANAFIDYVKKFTSENPIC